MRINKITSGRYTIGNARLPFVLSLAAIIVAAFFVGCGIGLSEDEKTAEIETLNGTISTVDDDFRVIIEDLTDIPGSDNLKTLVESGSGDARAALGEDFLTLSKGKNLYDQIRYLDEGGQEIVRIDYNSGSPAIVPEENLQNKGDRYYFEDTFELEEGEIFVSPLDLNIERGEIEKPIKPVIRFGTPVFNAAGEKKGIILINYLASGLLDNIKEAATGTSGELMLVNNEGYWLITPDPEEEWGFMYEDKKDVSFREDYFDAWLKITLDDSGQFEGGEGFFIYGTIYPLITAWRYSGTSDVAKLSSSEGAREAFEGSESSFKGTDYFWKVILFIPDV